LIELFLVNKVDHRTVRSYWLLPEHSLRDCP